MRFVAVRDLAAVSLVASVLVACDGVSSTRIAELRALGLSADQLPPSPTNGVADRDDAATLGRKLFFDERLSADGTVSCASCHDPFLGFSDPRPLSLGVEHRSGLRHSMPITNVAFQRALFWDGRADSLWSQPLQALEGDIEMDFTRTEVAHFIAASYRAEYEAVFGALPDLTAIPARARPGMPAWDSLPATERDSVQRIFANTGKLLEAFERRVLCVDTRFDRWTRGEIELSNDELEAGARFLDEGCITCHAGPNFSDGAFHNIGLGSSTAQPDRGAFDLAAHVAGDPMNGAGPYSDDPEAGAQLVAELAAVPRPLGSFRTPSLRGVTQRRAFGHLGHQLELEDFINDVYDEPHMHRGAVGELDDAVRGVELRAGRVMPFLRTLECPPAL